MDKTDSASSVAAEHHDLTRGQVAVRLGVSVSAVRRMEGRTLHPVLDSSGHWRFSPTELRAAPTRASCKKTRVRAVHVRGGEIAARVFEAFAAGHGLRQIVTRLRVEPAKVRELYAEWQIDLVTGERGRREKEQLSASAKDQRERIAWMRALDKDTTF